MEDQLWYNRLPDLDKAKKIKRYLANLLLVVNLLLLLPLTSCSTPANAQVEDKVQALLLSLAQEEPDLVPRLIVQFNGDSAALVDSVSELGGAVVSQLNIIDALVIELPAGRISELASVSTVSWISLDAPIYQSGELSGEVVLNEEFSLSDVGSTRVVNWRWFEVGEDDGMEAGDVLLTRFFGGEQEGLRIQNGGKGIETEVDLVLSSEASMQVSYRRKSFAENDAVRLEVSTNGGASWQFIERLAGPITDTNLMVSAFDLSPWVGNVIKLRFVSETGFSKEARFYLDFVRVQHVVVQPERNENVYLPFVAAPQPDTVVEAEVRAAGSVMTARDEFSTVSYANNNGNTSWSTGWIENDPAGVAGAGGSDYVAVVSSALRLHYTFANNESVKRSINIADAQNATLSFTWRTYGLDWFEDAAVQISTGPNGPFTTLKTVGWTGNGTFSADISAYRSPDTTIRIINASTNWEWGEWASFDNVQIQWTVASGVLPTPTPVSTPCTECIDKSNLKAVYPQTIGASDLWNEDVKKQGKGITIAVVDSGIAEHSDLTNKAGQSRILAHVDFTSGGTIDDFYGHGTHVAGAAVGNGKKSYGSYIGVAPEANLVDVKVTDDNGVGTTSSVMAGLQWVLEHKNLYGIRVVNMSLNSTVAESYHNSPLDAAAEMLWFNGIVVVVSSGNNGDNADAGIIYPPANDPYVITVGASDDKWTVSTGDDVLAPYTAYGYTNDGIMKPEILVPGTNIVAPLASDDANLAVNHSDHIVVGDGGSYYFRMSGTSMAAGVAAGTVALLLSSEPQLTPDQVKYRLMNSGVSYTSKMGAASCTLRAYYNGKWADGWENWSWNTAVEPYIVSSTQQGLAVTFSSGWAGFSLRANNWIDVNDVTEIRFKAYAPSTANQLRVWVHSNDTDSGPGYYDITLVPNQVMEYVIPVSVFGVNDIKRINIQERTGSAQPTFLLDDIRVTGDCTKETAFLDIRGAVRSTSTAAANQDAMPHSLLAKMAMIAYWANQTDGSTIDWASVNWNSVNWNLVNWNSVNWNSVNWNSVNWNSVNWNSVNWNSVNWNSVNWNSVNWNSVNWNSVNWNSVERNATEFDN